MPDTRALVRELKSLSKRIRQLERLEGGTTNLVNNSGGRLNPGDVVVIDAAENSVRMALGAGVRAPCVVVIGGDNEDLVKVTKRGYGKITITCDGGAIAAGDAIVTSATNGRGQGDNTATGRNLLGFALGSKGAGATSDVLILV